MDIHLEKGMHCVDCHFQQDNHGNTMLYNEVRAACEAAHALDFVLSLFLAFGVTFEVPVAVVILVRMGLVSVTKLKEIRPYMIVGAFVVGLV